MDVEQPDESDRIESTCADEAECHADVDDDNASNNAEQSSGPEVNLGDADVFTGAPEPTAEIDGIVEEESSNSSEDASSGGRLSRVAMKLPQYRRLRWWRESRRHLKDASFWRERDPQENEAGRLPEDERVEIPAIWVTELYTPSTVDGLLEGIHRLGWEFARTRDESLLKWMADVRGGRRAGWTRLGLVAPPGSQIFLRDREADLPAGVRAALPDLMSVTPGVTALVVCFLLEDETAACLHDPLRRDYSTFQEPDRRFRRWRLVPHVLWGADAHLGHRINTPDVQRRAEVKATTERLEALCRSWIQAQFPGAFAAQGGEVKLPTAALFVTDRHRPLIEDTARIGGFDALGLYRHFDSWESDEWPGCRMVLPRGWRDEATHLLLASRRHDAFPKRPGCPEPESNWTIAQRAHELVTGLLSRWSMSELLDAYHQRVSIDRDRVASGNTYRAVRDLKRARELVRSDAYDVQTAAEEIAQFADRDHNYRYNVLEMKYAREIRGEQVDLLDELRQAQQARSGQVIAGIRLLTSTVSSVADLTQTISNIRVQRLIILLSVASVIVATVALIAAQGG